MKFKDASSLKFKVVLVEAYRSMVYKLSVIFFWGLLVLNFTFFFACQPPEKKINSLIDTNPSQAKTFVNGQYLGHTPLLYRHYSNQKIVKLAFTKENFHLFEKDNYSLSNFNNIQLVPKVIRVKFWLSTSVDFFFLNEKRIEYPNQNKLISLNLKKGKYKIALFKSGYYPFKKNIHIQHDQQKVTINLKKINTLKKFSFQSSLKDIKVYLDNYWVGTLPYQDKIIKNYTYNFTFKKKQHLDRFFFFSANGQKNKNFNIDLLPLKTQVRPFKLIGLPPHTTFTISQNGKVILKSQKKEIWLSNNQYQIEFNNPNYFIFSNNINLKEKNFLKVELTKKPFPFLTLINKKKLNPPFHSTHFGLEYNSNFFFLHQEKLKKKIILDNSLNLIEKLNFPPTKHLLRPILDPTIFFDSLFSFSQTVLSKGRLYQSFSGQKESFKNVIYSHQHKKNLLIIDQGIPAILIYKYSSPKKEWEFSDQINFAKIKSYKKNLIPNLILSQAYFNGENNLVFIEKRNNLIYNYNLTQKKMKPFINQQEYTPIQVEALGFLKKLFLVKIENSKIRIFNSKGNFLSELKIANINEKINFLVVKKKILYLFSAKNIYLFKFN